MEEEDKIITEEDFWVCTEGAIPTQFQGTRELLHNEKGEVINYITKEDKSTVGWLDFGCKKYMLLAALVAAALVLLAVIVGALTVATGGAALIAVCALAGLVGGAIGGIVGGLLCGHKVAECREWFDYKLDMSTQGSYNITVKSYMTCKAGGVIRYAPNIKNWVDAIMYARLSYTNELIQCAGAGALVGLGGAMCGVGASAVAGTGGTMGAGFNFAGRAVTLLKPTWASVGKNLLGSIPFRILSGAENAQYTHATGGINKQGEQSSIGAEFADAALPEYDLYCRVKDKGIGGLQPSDALYLLYLLNVKFDPKGIFRDSKGGVRYARNNPWNKAPGSKASKIYDARYKPPQPKNGKPFQKGKAGQVRKNYAQGKAGENIATDKLKQEFPASKGYTVKEQVTAKLPNGKETIFDNVVYDKNGKIVLTNETKTGGGRYSENQAQYRQAQEATIVSDDPMINGKKVSTNTVQDRLTHVDTETGIITITEK